MSILNVIALGGGVALFLYGMSIMGNGLEKLSGGKMEKALESLTNNIFASVALGALVTALIQSSSATTVIVVGLVNAGILQLRQVVGVIMGANIGTTVTAQIIRLSDIQTGSLALQIFKPSTLAPAAAMAGILLFMLAKKPRKREIGEMLLGFGVLFSGMFAMEAAVKPLQNSPAFLEVLAAMSNPILGVVAGAVITAAIQSSSASIGMLQALSSTGLVRFSTAFPIIMGQNIGTCITPILSSIGASKNAKRAALIHLYFNVIGTAVFLVAVYGAKAILGEPAMWDEPVSRTAIANFHTFFNVAVTLLFIPFASLIEKLARLTIKDPNEGKDSVQDILDDRFLLSPSLALQQSGHVIERMTALALSNYRSSSSLLFNYDARLADRIREDENTIDKMEDQLESYLIKLAAQPLSEVDSRTVSILIRLTKEYERIGDYSINLVECAEEIDANDVVFTPQAIEELGILQKAVEEIIELSNTAFLSADPARAKQIEPLEETIDAIVEALKDGHVERLKTGLCTIFSGIVFLEILTNVERIADHCSNIGVHVLSITDQRGYNSHEYTRQAHAATDSAYIEQFDRYMREYYARVRALSDQGDET